MMILPEEELKGNKAGFTWFVGAGPNLSSCTNTWETINKTIKVVDNRYAFIDRHTTTLWLNNSSLLYLLACCFSKTVTRGITITNYSKGITKRKPRFCQQSFRLPPPVIRKNLYFSKEC